LREGKPRRLPLFLLGRPPISLANGSPAANMFCGGGEKLGRGDGEGR
jgi:hypothetical protein